MLHCLRSSTTRTITWEDEVPLNTGETIWIERSMPWGLLGGFGNPLDIELRPTRVQTIRFTYGGTEYSYIGRANVLWRRLVHYPPMRPVAPCRFRHIGKLWTRGTSSSQVIVRLQADIDTVVTMAARAAYTAPPLGQGSLPAEYFVVQTAIVGAWEATQAHP